MWTGKACFATPMFLVAYGWALSKLLAICADGQNANICFRLQIDIYNIDSFMSDNDTIYKHSLGLLVFSLNA